MTIIDYKDWVEEEAVQASNQVSSIEVEYLDDSTESFPNEETTISDLMDDFNLECDQIKNITFSGFDEEENPWLAVDHGDGTTIVRVEEDGSVPVKIRRPPGT